VLARRLLTCASSVVVALGLVAIPAAASAAAAPSKSARVGAGYLARQIDANGGHLGASDAPDVTDTAYAVLGLHAAGVGKKQSARAIAFLKTQVASLDDDPAALGYVVMAAVASRQDPRHFGGRKPVNDLVTRLLATERKSGPDAGLFGSADPTFDGAFRQGVALAALRAAGVGWEKASLPTVWLVRQQCANGLWTSYRPDVNVPCPAADPNAFVGPDTNSTGMAVQGLAAYRVYPNVRRTIGSLLHAQSSDGGYPFVGAPGQSSDPDSTALVIQALIADHVRPGRAVGALASFQLGCSDPAGSRGAYFFPGGSRDVSLLATVQSVPASALKSLPLAPSSLSAAVPTTKCPRSTNTSLTNAVVGSTAKRPAVTLNAAVGTAGPCSGNSGVTVTVDFTAFNSTEQTRCAPGSQSSGVAALQDAGFIPAGTSRYGLAFICRINNLPSASQQACVTTPPTTAYWAYYHALSGATTWTFSTQGASSYVPPLGSIDAWAFGNSAKPSMTPAQVRAPK
jgi:hypothetical protein